MIKLNKNFLALIVELNEHVVQIIVIGLVLLQGVNGMRLIRNVKKDKKLIIQSTNCISLNLHILQYLIIQDTIN